MIVGEQVAALLGLWWPIDCQKYQVRLKVDKHGDDGDVDGEDDDDDDDDDGQAGEFCFLRPGRMSRRRRTSPSSPIPCREDSLTGSIR